VESVGKHFQIDVRLRRLDIRKRLVDLVSVRQILIVELLAILTVAIVAFKANVKCGARGVPQKAIAIVIQY
jgi:hypothetical protein